MDDFIRKSIIAIAHKIDIKLPQNEFLERYLLCTHVIYQLACTPICQWSLAANRGPQRAIMTGPGSTTLICRL